jgi:hypothetical protein
VPLKFVCRDYAPAAGDLATQGEFNVSLELGLDETEMLLNAGQAAMHGAHNAEEAVERLSVLAERDRVLIQSAPMLYLNALDVGDVGAD